VCQARFSSCILTAMTLASFLDAGALAGAHALARYRSEFPIFRDAIYLNTCSLGALGERTRRRSAEFFDLWQTRGASAWYDVWWDALAELRTRYARVVGASPAEIALAPSVSVALSAVAEAIDYRRRPKVVVTALDFPTVAYQWLAKRPRGVELVVVESPDGISVPLEAIAAAVDDRTALVATSHVYFTSGAIQDIKSVAEVARRRGALTLVDAYQSVGQVPVDVKAAGVDFLTAGGLKWLLGGPGIVLLYVRAELAPQLAPAIVGWFGHRNQFAFDPRVLELHDDARRFELGTPSLAAVYAQLGGLDYIDEIGIPAIRRVTAALTEDLIARARDLGLRPKVASRAEDRSAIVMLPAPDPAAGVRHLAAAKIIADARPGHVRLSPFFYNVQDDHVSALERLATHSGH
jgi:kynureninase